jgi:hypothetical protein
MALILYATGRDPEELKVEDITLSRLQNIVAGYIERLVCLPNTDGEITHILYVNDEARLLGGPFNQSASQAIGMTILGDAVIMTKEEDKIWNTPKEVSE